jgi:hypothetical protein
MYKKEGKVRKRKEIKGGKGRGAGEERTRRKDRPW